MALSKPKPLESLLKHESKETRPEDIEKLCRRLLYWTERFIDEFQLKLEDYEQEAVGRKDKLHTRTKGLQLALQGLGATVGGVASFLAGSGFGGVAPGKMVSEKGAGLLKYADTHKNKAKNVTLRQQALCKGSSEKDVRVSLTRIAVVIFMSYEEQLMTVFDDELWLSHKEAMIRDAIKRIMNYLDNYPGNACTKSGETEIGDENFIRASFRKIVNYVSTGGSDRGNLGEIKEENQLDNKCSKEINEDIKRKNEDSTIKEVSQLSKDSNVNVDKIFEDFIINAFLLSDSSQATSKKMVQTSKKLAKKKDWTFSRLDRKLGLIEGPEQLYYYPENDKNGHPKFGHRLRFPNEKRPISQPYEPNQKYHYILDQSQLDKIVETILQEKDDKESEKSNRGIKKMLDTIIERLPPVEKKDITPFLFAIIPPVASFTGRLDKLEEVHEKLQKNDSQGRISRAVCISGMGGMGKTELARKFAQKYAVNYGQNIVWITSDTQQNLEKSFKDLAEKCEIETVRTVNGKSVQLSVSEIVEKIYMYFAKKTSLFIFDNVENYQSVSPFLPPASVSTSNRPYIILTSRNINWNPGQEGRIDKVDLIKFEDGFELIKTILKFEGQDEQIQQLVEILHNLPLALQQAAAVIVQKNIDFSKRNGGAYLVGDYIRDFQSNKKEFLEKHFAVNSDDEQRYLNTVYTTWNVTLDYIKGRSCGAKALQIIRIMAYMAPQAINLKLWFLENWNDDADWEPIELLEQYSMINRYEGSVRIHRLVQEVIRIQLGDDNLEGVILKEALALTKLKYFHNNSLHSYSNHVISIWNHASDHQELVEDICANSIIEDIPLKLLTKGGCTKAASIILTYSEQSKPELFKDIIERSEMYTSYLKYAISSGNLEMVRIFCEKGARSDMVTCGDTDNVLHIAASRGFLDITEYLVEHTGIPTERENAKRETPAYQAAIQGFVDVAEYLTKGLPDDDRFRYKLAASIRAVHSAETFRKLRNTLNHLRSKNLSILINAKLKMERPLELAIHKDYPGLVTLLVEYGADISYKTYRGDSYLKSACLYGRNFAVQDLICTNADIDETDKYGFTLVHQACCDGHMNVITTLMEAGIDLTKTDQLGCNVLFHVPYFYLSDLSIIEFLGERLFDMHIKDKLGRTALHSAVRGLYKFTKYFVENGVDPKEPDCFGYTLLHYATSICDLEMLSFHDYDGLEAVFEAANRSIPSREMLSRYCMQLHLNWGRNLDTIEYLLEKGVDPNVADRNGHTALFFAAYHCIRGSVKLLLEATDTSCASEADNDGRTPLHFALMSENFRIAGLVAKNVFALEISATNYEHLYFNTTPMYKIFHLETVKYLLKFASLATCDTYGCTPLHYASLYNNFSTVQFLISKGADITAKDCSGSTPLHYAAICGNFDVIRRVTVDAVSNANGSALAHTNNYGQTLLHAAVLSVGPSYNALDVARALIKAGIDVNAPDTQGRTPLHYARYKNDSKMVELLITEGKADISKTNEQLVDDKYSINKITVP